MNSDNRKFLFITEIIILCISFLLLGVLMTFPDKMQFIVNCHFYIYLSLIIINYLRCQRFNLYQIWLVGYIYVILSEMILMPNQADFSISKYLESITYLILANDILLLGYYIYKPKTNKSNTYALHSTFRNTKYTWILLFILLLLYIYMTVSNAIHIFLYGRYYGKTATRLFPLFMSSIGLILPTLAAYYYKYIKKGNVYNSLLWSIPIFIILFLEGIRFRLLYSVIPYLIMINLFKVEEGVSIKKNLILLIILIFLVAVSSFIKGNRGPESNNIRTISNEPLTVQIASHFSPEGVVRMTNMAENYYQTHPHSYGKETAFILYFWIPRAIWPNKPSQLGYWLIRKYENVSESHSVSFGFTGELMADFGWFSLFFVFLLGLLIKKGDIFINNLFSGNSNSTHKIIGALLYPYVFFAVRSLITATMSLIYALSIYLIFYLLFIQKNKEYKFK